MTDSPLAATLLSIAMLGVLALLVGATLLWRGGERQKPLLMVAAAVVTFLNVLIWSV
ncbi:hypothetical protein [Sphingomonas baiyangensis]|uniref:hypothetical protein n=1 Tax=Sphingomonas baiyangensis TaxID=2572576 RepID=UPI00146D0690|nr:hypothetical protein [Sphingomonas baiyangensis]